MKPVPWLWEWTLFASLLLTGISATAQTNYCAYDSTTSHNGTLRGFAASSDGRWVAVSAAGQGLLHVFDTVTDQFVCTDIPAGVGPDGPNGVAFSPGDQYIYLVNEQGRTIYVYDVRALPACPTAAVASVALVNNGFRIAVDPLRNRAYVSDGLSPIEVFDLTDPALPAYTGAMGTTQGAASLALSPDSRWLYFTPSAANRYDGIYVIDLEADLEQGRIPAAGATNLKLSEEGATLYATTRDSRLIAVGVDPAAPWINPDICTVPDFGGFAASSLELTSDGAHVVVAGVDSENIVFLDRTALSACQTALTCEYQVTRAWAALPYPDGCKTLAFTRPGGVDILQCQTGTPVRYGSYTAGVDSTGTVKVRWTTLSERDTLGFTVVQRVQTGGRNARETSTTVFVPANGSGRYEADHHLPPHASPAQVSYQVVELAISGAASRTPWFGLSGRDSGHAVGRSRAR